MTDTNCGYEDTASGEPCKRDAGWGRDVDEGYCKDHADEAGDPAHRPTKLTYENQEKIAAVIEQGGSITEAARKVSLHRETIGNWAERGRKQDEGIYADFFDRLTRAQGQGEGTYRQALMQIAIETEDTATLMAMLKQRYPESWGEVERGEQAGGVVVDLGDADEYEIDPDTLEVVDG